MTTLTATQLVRDTPSRRSPVRGGVRRDTVLDVRAVWTRFESTDAVQDVWLELAGGGWLPARLDGYVYVDALPAGTTP